MKRLGIQSETTSNHISKRDYPKEKKKAIKKKMKKKYDEMLVLVKKDSK